MIFVPSFRTNDVVILDPSDVSHPFAFNMLEDVEDPNKRNLMASGLLGVFKKMYAESWGPRLEHILRNCLLSLVEYPNTSMLGIMRILVDKDYRKRVVEKIQKKANEIVKKNYKIKKEVLPRPEAEKKYGFRIYQGAAVPSKILRIISIDDIEHEACGGTHLDQTKDAGKIVILKTEKPHDGIVRISYVSGEAAEKYL